MLAAQVLLAALLLVVRAVSVFKIGQWWETTGVEGVHLAIIRRVAAGGPLYQDINIDSTTAIYNYGFYRIYAAIASAVPRPGDLLLLRSVSLVAALCAAAGLAAIVETLDRGRAWLTRPHECVGSRATSTP